MKHPRFAPILCALLIAQSSLSAQSGAPTVPTPPGILPGSITAEDVPYPYPSTYFSITTQGQELRMAYMDIAPTAPPNGHTVVLLHGNNFAGFYFGGFANALAAAGFRVIVPDQIGYGRSSKPTTIQYNFHEWARNTRLLIGSLQIPRAMIVGHSMGGMLAARFATQYPSLTERLVLYNPIGLTDARFARPWAGIDEAYKTTLGSSYQSIRAGLMRYVAHKPGAWNDAFERYTRIRYAWTLGAEWPRLAMVQALISQVQYLDPVVYDWSHIQATTLVFGGAEDYLAGTPAEFQARMKYISSTIPNGKARLLLLPGLGHVPHLESPEKTLPPLIDFLKDGVTP
ncbi:MAG: alpha/beta hydrolase [Vicinamibacterales bacterium]